MAGPNVRLNWFNPNPLKKWVQGDPVLMLGGDDLAGHVAERVMDDGEWWSRRTDTDIINYPRLILQDHVCGPAPRRAVFVCARRVVLCPSSTGVK